MQPQQPAAEVSVEQSYDGEVIEDEQESERPIKEFACSDQQEEEPLRSQASKESRVKKRPESAHHNKRPDSSASKYGTGIRPMVYGSLMEQVDALVEKMLVI